MRYGREDRIRELQAEIDRLRAEQEAPPVWTPFFAEAYYLTDSDEVVKYYFYDDSIDRTYLELGNVYQSEQEAENHNRALELIETISRERYEAQGHWWPGVSVLESIFTICGNRLEDGVGINTMNWSRSSSVFGLWRDRDILADVIRKYDTELWWYFTEYLPSIN